MKALAKYILNLRKKDKIIDNFLNIFSYKWDIEKSFNKENIIYEISLEEFLKNHNDGEFECVFVIDNNKQKCLSILGRKDEYEMDSDEEFATHLLYSVSEITTKNQLLSYLKNKDTNCNIFILSLFKCIQKDKNKRRGGYNSDYINYLYEKIKQERLRKAVSANYLKIVKKVFNKINIDNSKIEDIKYIKELLIDAYINIYKGLYKIKYVKELISINEIKFLDFEYDLKRNKIWLDFRVEYVYREKDFSLRKEKYNSLLPNMKSIQIQSTEIDTILLKEYIFKIIFAKSLLGFCSLFRGLFVNNDCSQTLCNLFESIYNRVDNYTYPIIDKDYY